MKKLITTLALSFFIVTAFSQEVQNDQDAISNRETGKNELSIGALNLVAFGALDVAYERIITPNSSWAVEAFILALDRESEDAADAYSKDFSLTGKYKYFFGERTAWGFYVNGLAMISSGEYEKDVLQPDGWYEYETEDYTDFALGFGLGGKFVSRQGFFLDLSTGIGRNLFSNNSPTIIGQFNVNLGFRF
ncbi:hypothetical protein FHG64_01180 [Antarcticibacterium flavum]|uniref:DUF3575 domain-containing protein n=1 Tax=Antarcticibacterium flavum TaxID=2058175 RepID=A0A5B7WYB9_9FLAO|nr:MULTISPECIES: hypothetical protein [Antarcticibacterium]MCM4158860.1 hypothetical protein [Antarcticibacterium sp. W02-3]QCY68119.1 hypothetical protein FHG64_01180 [Antarcticibacterium flavum]